MQLKVKVKANKPPGKKLEHAPGPKENPQIKKDFPLNSRVVYNSPEYKNMFKHEYHVVGFYGNGILIHEKKGITLGSYYVAPSTLVLKK